MKATLIGYKKFKGKKDGRTWIQLGVIYKDVQAVGGSFASAVLLPGENFKDGDLIPGELYDIDFDSRGSVLGIEHIKS